jgi:hypothetical protein
MASETYLNEPASTPKREADSSAQACSCCCYSACVTNMDPRVKEVLLWSCPCRSVVVFLAGLVLLLTVQMCSAFEVLGYLGFALLIVGGAGRLVRMFLGPPPPQTQQAPSSSTEGCSGCPVSSAACPITECKRSLVAQLGCLEQSKWEVSEQCAKETLQRALPHVNCSLAQLKAVFLLTDTIKAIKFGVFCWLLLYIGSWFDLLTLLQIVWVVLFSLPKIYTLYQVQIDNVLNKAKGFTAKYWDQVKSKVPGVAKQKAQ